MVMDRINGMSVGWRVAAGAIAAAGVLLTVALVFAGLNTLRTERGLLEADMKAKVERVGDAMQASNASLLKLIDNQYRLFEGMFDQQQWTLRDNVDMAGKPRPILMLGGESMNGNSTEVDRFAGLTGGVATVFARAGDDLLRVATSVKKEDGSRAVGTTLDRAHPAYRPLMDGKPFSGRATLFGKQYMTKYVPLKDGSRVIGVLFVGIDISDELASLSRLMQANRILESGHVYAIDLRDGASLGNVIGLAEGATRLDPKDEGVAGLIEKLRALPAEGGELAHGWSVLERKAPDDQHAYYARLEPAWNLMVVAEAHGDEMNRMSVRILVPIVIAVLMALVGLAAAVIWITRQAITRPIRELRASLQYLADGDLSRSFASSRRDEIGELVNSLEAVRQRLAQALQVVRESAESINTASREIATGNQDLSNRTEQQASSLQQTAASVDQMTGSVKQNADAARQANQLAASASQVAEKGGAVVGQVVSTMDEITASSRKIAEIIGVIDGIAFQTNILALNAAMEAARAGEQGRGFAVVAGEVRALAQRSAQAAREIKSLISDSVQKVENGSKLVNDAGTTMQEIVAQVKRVNDLIGEITSATLEQSNGIGQVNQAVTQLDQMTQQNAALVEQSAAAAESLREQADKLAQAVAVFRTTREQTQQVIAQAQASSRATVAPRAAPPPGAAKAAPTSAPPASGAPSTPPARSSGAAKSNPPRRPPASPGSDVGGDWKEF